ncbi:hypothetical protein GCM10010347_05950 [Streptomyces cirratus]|uniref:Uncharacterized protein n=1 Tax=Streptomyces cirratus TaxID=68187 RepID=A0ABQ3EL34_9ACTN|nr:hypothetical protein GCM10010347_05950 [Streptomyces cirratus]
MVPAAQQQRHEDGLPGDGVERLAEQRPVQLDVPEADVEAGAELADPLQQGPDAGERAGVTAAVGDGDEGGLHAGTPLVRAPGGRTASSCAPSWTVIRVSNSAAVAGGNGKSGNSGGCAGSVMNRSCGAQVAAALRRHDGSLRAAHSGRGGVRPGGG